MKICFVGSACSAHIEKWCKYLTAHGHEVHVISFQAGEIEGTQVHLVSVDVPTWGSDLVKSKYLFTGKQIKRYLEIIRPDIVSVHYASSYGVAMALSGVKDYVLSVWGSDVYDFPKRSLLHKLLLMYSLRKAKYLFSTSYAMANEAAKYTHRKFEITPFGVDMELFNPDKRTRKTDSCEQKKEFVVGTVKKLSHKYGIRYILEAVAAVKKEGNIPIRLRIAGNGPQEEEYHKLADTLGISDITTWLGFISQEQAAIEWANMDVAIIPSTLDSESFGVSAVEAQACGIPVIISDIPGLMEATNPGESSIVVKRKESTGIVSAINTLYQNPDLRQKMGINGTSYVRERYELNHCFCEIEEKLLNYSMHV